MRLRGNDNLLVIGKRHRTLRQCEREVRTFPRLALHAYIAVVLLGDILGQSQADSGSGYALRHRVGRLRALVEAFEHFILFLGGDSDTRITYMNVHLLLIRLYGQLDFSARRRVFDRVEDKVHQDLLQMETIHIYHRIRRIGNHSQLDVFS